MAAPCEVLVTTPRVEAGWHSDLTPATAVATTTATTAAATTTTATVAIAVADTNVHDRVIGPPVPLCELALLLHLLRLLLELQPVVLEEMLLLPLPP